MYESLISLKEQFGLYFDILRFFLYFCVGALLLFFFRKIYKIFQFLVYKFNKDFFFEKIKTSLNITTFYSYFILVGWLVIFFKI